MKDYESVKHIAKYVPVDELELLENNPRTIKKEAFEKLKKSVNEYREYFEGRPCLANKVGDKITVFAGNQRLRAARALGWKEVPCVIYENLSAEEQQRLTIKDNVQLGEWDFDILANEFNVEMLEDEGISNFKTGLADEKEIEQKPPEIVTSFITLEYTDEIELKITDETAQSLMAEMLRYKNERGTYEGFWDERLKK